MARAEPTIVASSPIARCRKPPIFALAYISPARSSKRRMSIIVPSHSRARSGSGRSCSAILAEATPCGPQRTSGAVGHTTAGAGAGHPTRGTVRPIYRPKVRLVREARLSARSPGLPSPRCAVRRRPSKARPGAGRRPRASPGVARPRPPPRDEVLGLHRVEVLADGTGEAADPARREIPQQDGLAVGDVDDLDRVAPDEDAVRRLRPHAAETAAAARAAAGSQASPWKT